MPEPIQLTVNGTLHAPPAEPGRSLLVLLREELGLTGAKYGCAVGACGACTVLVDGAPARACVTPLAEVAGAAVTTIEGLTPPGQLHPVQNALVAVGATQCGYCTPGMVLAAAALLAEQPDPDDAQIIRALDGNICRCCAYPRILRAVRAAARGADTAERARAARPAEAGRTKESERLPHAAWSTAHAEASAGPAVPWDLQEQQERDYFEVLPDGLVTVLPPATGGRAGPWRANGGVWIHVGADGAVTAFAGKVDVGQDNGTALAMLVAEELGVPLRAVRMVLGDTDLCPFDIGTFGSRSMPDTGQALATAAAAARHALIAMAATALEVDPGLLSATGGAVKDNSTGTAVGYGDLLRGRRQTVTAAADTPVADRLAWRTAGQPTLKLAADAVTGARSFASDLTLPGMLHGKVLRPPAYGATLRHADLSRARSVPGVVVVHEGSFAAVAGPDPVTAARALELIDAAWDRAPQPGEQVLAAHLRSHPRDAEGWGGPFNHETGDATAALESAGTRVAATYTTAYIAHVPLEPRAAVAEWSGGRLTLWTGTQRPFGVRQELAAALGVPEAGVRVIVPWTGSGFGGKHAGPVAVEAALLARAAGRPVKVQWSREEEFTWGYFRPAAVIDVTSGAESSEDAGFGRDMGPGAGNGAGAELTGWEFTNLNGGAAGIRTPYLVPNQRITFQPAHSPLPQGPYRALAATTNNFARESHMDEVAHELGVDPLDFRLWQLDDDRLAAVLRAAAQRAAWLGGGSAQRGHGPGRENGHGLGIACGMEKDGRVATCAEVSVTPEGRLSIYRIVTAYDCGAIVNPDNVVNQIEGATVMALGGALFEAIHFDDGAILNASLSTYRVPRFSDAPPIEVILLDRKDIPPAGAGETPLIAVAPALANAIFAATGQRIRSMPLLREGKLPERP